MNVEFIDGGREAAKVEIFYKNKNGGREEYKRT